MTNSLETLSKIIDNIEFATLLKYCLVDQDKKPHKIDGSLCRPNHVEDFVSLDELITCNKLTEYSGIGISIQASNIFAIDIDKCFSIANDITSGSTQVKDILDKFKDVAYCEFSFSGTGLRILFFYELIDDYSQKYFIKNTKRGIEFYQPSNSFRYVTLTGNKLSTICKTDKKLENVVTQFLDTYMLREVTTQHVVKNTCVSEKTIDELMTDVKKLYLTNFRFQDLWFGNAPGSGRNESELDYQLLSMIYEHITQDYEMIKEIFEASNYFLSKDKKHLYKWTSSDNRYFKYVYNQIRRRHGF